MVFFLCDTCCLSQSISTISCSLVICVMSLMCLKFIYIQWDKFELCAMLLSNNLTCVFMTSFWIPLSCFINHFICTRFFVDVYHQQFVYLETYTYERGHFLIGILFLLSRLEYYLWFFCGSEKKISHQCLSYFYLYLCALKFCWGSFTSCLLWWVCWFLLAKCSY